MSTISIKLKRLGKKKIKHIEVTLEKQPETLIELITECVKSDWNRFKEKTEDQTLVSFLTVNKIQNFIEDGKVSFGALENREIIPLEEAIDNAILAFKDGLFVVFLDDIELKNLEQKVRITPDTTFTFIRLTFLTGTYWS